MPSGLTGGYALRIYSPGPQSRKLDPEGAFIRRWLPELEGVPNEFIHAPWQMTFSQKQRFGGDQYIDPVCDQEQAAREARQAMDDFIRQRVRREETNRVLARHGSRRRQDRGHASGTVSSEDDQQLALF